MARQITDTGEYTNKDNSEIVKFSFDYPAYDSVADAVDSIGEGKTLATLNRMAKVDARNGASVTAQSKNGHNARAGMTAEQKSANKAGRAKNKAILDFLASKGIDSIAEAEALL